MSDPVGELLAKAEQNEEVIKLLKTFTRSQGQHVIF